MFANQELSGYESILGVPFFTDNQPHGYEFQLVYTASFVVEDHKGIEVPKRLSVVLALDACMRLSQMRKIIELASPMKPRGIAFTRLDLLTDFGAILDVYREYQIPILGASLSQTFQISFKFFEPKELATLIVRGRNSL